MGQVRESEGPKVREFEGSGTGREPSDRGPSNLRTWRVCFKAYDVCLIVCAPP
jgi:hypothetical protein